MTNRKIHYWQESLYEEDYGVDNYYCGSTWADTCEKTTTSNWEHVTCKRCLKIKNKIIKSEEEDEKRIVEQMGDFVDFCNGEGRYKND